MESRPMTDQQVIAPTLGEVLGLLDDIVVLYDRHAKMRPEVRLEDALARGYSDGF
jgi:hypothetical protein